MNKSSSFSYLSWTKTCRVNFLIRKCGTYRASWVRIFLFFMQIVEAVVRISPMMTTALAMPTYSDPAVLSKDSSSKTSCAVEPTPCRHILFLRKLRKVLLAGQRDVVTLIWIWTSIWALFRPVQANSMLKSAVLIELFDRRPHELNVKVSCALTKTSAQMSESHRLMKYSSAAAGGLLLLHISAPGRTVTEISTFLLRVAAEIDSNTGGYRPRAIYVLKYSDRRTTYLHSLTSYSTCGKIKTIDRTLICFASQQREFWPRMFVFAINLWFIQGCALCHKGKRNKWNGL